MLGSPDDGEDALQDALLRAWRGLCLFEGRSSLRNWLYRIATNASLDALARRPERAVPIEDALPAGVNGRDKPASSEDGVGFVNSVMRICREILLAPRAEDRSFLNARTHRSRTQTQPLPPSNARSWPATRQGRLGVFEPPPEWDAAEQLEPRPEL